MCTEAKGSRALGKHGDIWICLIHGTPEPSQKLLIKQITNQNSSSYPRIHPELHWECRQHSGKQRMEFVRGELLLAQGSIAEIKGSSFDIGLNQVPVGYCRGTGSGRLAFARVRLYGLGRFCACVHWAT